MSDAGDFVDDALRREGSPYRAEAERARLQTDLAFYGASVGAVRGSIRDMGRRYRNLGHDEVTALSSELWNVAVFERRLAAIVLLQSNLRLLSVFDLTRIEGFLRTAELTALTDPLAADVVRPLVDALDAPGSRRAQVIIERWANDENAGLRRAAGLAHPL